MSERILTPRMRCSKLEPALNMMLGIVSNTNTNVRRSKLSDTKKRKTPAEVTKESVSVQPEIITIACSMKLPDSQKTLSKIVIT
jgi:hypothetical protein